MSENKSNKLVSVSYQLYDVSNGQKVLVEMTEEAKPATFISGMGFMLEDFERQVVDLAVGDSFNFELTPEQAFGPRNNDLVKSVDKHIFEIDGKFDSKHVYPDAILMLQNEAGDHFNGRVVEVGPDTVTIDLNHPLAGCTLNFVGQVLANREATKEEMAQLAKAMSGEGCGGHCDNCSGGCGGHGEEGCGGGCGEGCGHCH